MAGNRVPKPFIEGYLAAVRDISANYPDTWAELCVIDNDPRCAAINAHAGPEWMVTQRRLFYHQVREEREERAERERDTPKKPLREGVVYVLRNEDGSKIKIGWTSQTVAERIHQIQKVSGETLTALHSKPGSHKDERKLLESFVEERLHGEWFRPVGRLLSWMEGLGIA